MIKEWPRERDDDRPARATELMGRRAQRIGRQAELAVRRKSR
jgi:hypothetical protein